MINKMRATKGRGFDIISPTNATSLQWQPLELIQPFDMNRVNTTTVNDAMLKIGESEWNFEGKGVHWLPHIWGTEAMAWRTDLYSPPGGIPSYGNVWQPEVRGKTMMRAHSGMLGTGLYLETIGKLEPGDVWRAYESEEKMRPVWDTITKFCIDNKKQIKFFWNDADSQKNGLLNEGVIIGQTWDGPPLALKTQGEAVTYQAPREGAKSKDRFLKAHPALERGKVDPRKVQHVGIDRLRRVRRLSGNHMRGLALKIGFLADQTLVGDRTAEIVDGAAPRHYLPGFLFILTKDLSDAAMASVKQHAQVGCRQHAPLSIGIVGRAHERPLENLRKALVRAQFADLILTGYRDDHRHLPCARERFALRGAFVERHSRPEGLPRHQPPACDAVAIDEGQEFVDQEFDDPGTAQARELAPDEGNQRMAQRLAGLGAVLLFAVMDFLRNHSMPPFFAAFSGAASVIGSVEASWFSS